MRGFVVSGAAVERYEPDRIERKWQEVWERERAFHVPNPDPGEDGARRATHVRARDAAVPVGRAPHGARAATTRSATWSPTSGAVLGTTVLRPMGYDAFGLPAENAAIREGGHPRAVTERNIAAIREQMRRMGWAIDWDREVVDARAVLLPLDAVALPEASSSRASPTGTRRRSTGAPRTRPCSPTSR